MEIAAYNAKIFRKNNLHSRLHELSTSGLWPAALFHLNDDGFWGKLCPKGVFFYSSTAAAAPLHFKAKFVYNLHRDFAVKSLSLHEVKSTSLVQDKMQKNSKFQIVYYIYIHFFSCITRTSSYNRVEKNNCAQHWIPMFFKHFRNLL